MAVKNTKKLSLKPLGDRVVLKVLKNQTKTASGIMLPSSATEDKGMKRGEVVAVGPGKKNDGKNEKMTLKAKDIVLFQWGDDISFEGEDFVILRESEIIALIS